MVHATAKLHKNSDTLVNNLLHHTFRHAFNQHLSIILRLSLTLRLESNAHPSVICG